jgi:outer membrane protein
MKNGMMIWNVVLSLVAAVLLFLQFKPGKKTNATFKPVADSSARNFRIAYFEMDSVEAHFDMVKEVKAEIVDKNTELEKNEGGLDAEYRKKFEALSSKEYTTQDEKDRAQAELTQFGETLKARKEDYEQKYQEFVMRSNLAVKSKIEEFLKTYNKDNRYSYIISYETGLFYYKDTAYNITGDLILGLNEAYRKDKKAKPEQK